MAEAASLRQEEENGWEKAAAAANNGGGIILQSVNLNSQTDMDEVYEALKVTGPGPKSRLRTYIQRLQTQQQQQRLQLQQQRQQQPQPGDRLSHISSADVSCCKLSREFLEENELHLYAAAAHVCVDDAEVQAMLTKLENVYDEVQSDDIPAPFSCIVAPSGTGKTQLAATAARMACQGGQSVVYLYTGTDLSPSTIQRFYKPHTSLNAILLDELTKFQKDTERNTASDGDASDFLLRAQFLESPLFVLLHKIFFDEDRATATLKTFRDRFTQERKIYNSKPLVFLDEVPSLQALRKFSLVMLLRNILRAAGVCPILMSTHSGVVNAVTQGENSRSDEANPLWCKVFVRLPPYVADKDIFEKNPWIIRSERPLVACLMTSFAEKYDATQIVDMVKKRLQSQKPKAWKDNPAMQLCQLFRTKSGDETSADVIPECKHMVVGTHFGHIALSDNDNDITRGEAQNWMKRRRVQFVVPEKEPILFLALATWKMDCLEGCEIPYFPLVEKSTGKAISVKKAFKSSSDYFQKPISTGNSAAHKNDGDDLEVLALASVTLATLQIDDGLFQGIKLPQFVASVYHFMREDILESSVLKESAETIDALLRGGKQSAQHNWSSIIVPACPCAESTFKDVWDTTKVASFSSGRIKRPADQERRDGVVTDELGNSSLHIECKNYQNGITTQVLEKIIERMRDGYMVSLFFVSGVRRSVFTGGGDWCEFTDGLGLDEEKLCLLTLSTKGFSWLAVESGRKVLDPGENTTHLAVLIETGVVSPRE